MASAIIVCLYFSFLWVSWCFCIVIFANTNVFIEKIKTKKLFFLFFFANNKICLDVVWHDLLIFFVLISYVLFVPVFVYNVVFLFFDLPLVFFLINVFFFFYLWSYCVVFFFFFLLFANNKIISMVVKHQICYFFCVLWYFMCLQLFSLVFRVFACDLCNVFICIIILMVVWAKICNFVLYFFESRFGCV